VIKKKNVFNWAASLTFGFPIGVFLTFFVFNIIVLPDEFFYLILFSSGLLISILCFKYSRFIFKKEVANKYFIYFFAMMITFSFLVFFTDVSIRTPYRLNRITIHDNDISSSQQGVHKLSINFKNNESISCTLINVNGSIHGPQDDIYFEKLNQDILIEFLYRPSLNVLEIFIENPDSGVGDFDIKNGIKKLSIQQEYEDGINNISINFGLSYLLYKVIDYLYKLSIISFFLNLFALLISSFFYLYNKDPVITRNQFINKVAKLKTHYLYSRIFLPIYTFISNTLTNFPYIPLLVFLVAYGITMMSTYGFRTASIPQDDGSIFYADAFKFPENYSGVYQYNYPIRIILPIKLITSALVWIPAILWNFLNIDPYLVAFVLLLIQILSIGIVVYFLVRSFINDRIVPLMASIFVYLTSIWHYTPANYGPNPYDRIFPYAAELAIAPGLLAFLFMTRGKTQAALIMLIITGLIHPNLAVYAAAVMGFYWLWEGLQNRSYSVMFHHFMGLLFAGVLFLLPTIILRITQPSDSMLSASEFIAGMKLNIHIWPWRSFLNFKSLHAFLAWLFLAILGWRHREKLSKEYRRLWLSGLAAGCVFSLSHILGGVFEVPMLLNIIGQRAFIWLSLISLPLIMQYWYIHIRSGNWLRVTLPLLYMALPLLAKQSYNFYWLLVFAFLFLDLSQGNLAIWKFKLNEGLSHASRIISKLFLFLWISSFLFLPHNSDHLILNILSFLTWVDKKILDQGDRLVLIVIVAFIAVLIWGSSELITRLNLNKTNKWRRFISIFLGLLVAFYGIQYVALQRNSITYQSNSNSNYLMDTQIWARENTPTSSLFVTTTSWMNIARRGKFNPFTRSASQYYSSREAEQFRIRLLKFYGFTEEEITGNRGTIDKEARNVYSSFTEIDFMNFALEFGATHLVSEEQGEAPKLQLPVVYRNPSYTIYCLEP